jgi:DNA invertase Pin-like site-specific DNA recombinase
VVGWRLDRWGRSLVDLVTTLQELAALKVGFVSLSEAFDMTTPSGPALAGMLAVFAAFDREILRDRVMAEIAQARREGRPPGRPQTVANTLRRSSGFSGGPRQARTRQAPEHWQGVREETPTTNREASRFACNF